MREIDIEHKPITICCDLPAAVAALRANGTAETDLSEMLKASLYEGWKSGFTAGWSAGEGDAIVRAKDLLRQWVRDGKQPDVDLAPSELLESIRALSESIKALSESQPVINVAAPVVNVAATVVRNEITTPAPIVNVLPRPAQTVIRDESGRITGTKDADT